MVKLVSDAFSTLDKAGTLQDHPATAGRPTAASAVIPVSVRVKILASRTANLGLAVTAQRPSGSGQIAGFFHSQCSGARPPVPSGHKTRRGRCITCETHAGIRLLDRGQQLLECLFVIDRFKAFEASRRTP